MKKKIILILLVTILISLSYFSNAIVESSSSFPKITITFSKKYQQIDPTYKVAINSSQIKVNLTDPTGFSYKTRFIDPETDLPLSGSVISDVFAVTTIDSLENGNYTLKIKAVDVVNNSINTTIKLVIDVPYMPIYIHNPPLSISPKSVFDLEVRTDEPSTECKYDSVATKYRDALFTFSMVDPTHFLKSNFNNQTALTYFGLTDHAEKPIYVSCRDVLANRTNPKKLIIGYDTSKPQITAVSDPAVVTDLIQGEAVATLKVSSDDRVVCRYSKFQYNSAASSGRTEVYVPTTSNFSKMENYFGTSADENNETKYVIEPSTVISGVIDNVSKIYDITVNVACMNRATLDLDTHGPNRVSDARAVKVIVNLMTPITITKTSPPRYTKNSSIFINITTNRLSSCTYKFNESSGVLVSSNQRTHTKLLTTQYPQGNYNLEVTCTGAAATEATASFPITIDTSAPLLPPTIRSPNVTCTKTLKATFNASDPESGIRGYNYTIVGPGVNVTNVFTTSGTATENNLNLSNTSTYYFKATAINNVGLSSAVGQGNQIMYDNTGVRCDKTPPTIFIRQNMTGIGVIVTLVCVDTGSGCNNNSYTYFMSQDQSCAGTFMPLYYDEEKSHFAVLVSEDGYFCYEAKDMAGNIVTGSERILFQSQPGCFNTLLDGGETDVDCGGSTTCLRCELDENCILNSDCKSQYCKDGICTNPSCTDFIKNGFESDVDCGGILCSKCDINKTCNSNSDCNSIYCNLDKLCDIPTCDDDVANGNETDVDCGGNCDKCAAGKDCILNSDCITDFCHTGKCVQEPGDEYLPPVTQEEKGSTLLKILKILFFILGVLGIGGGIGYIYYKKNLPQKPKAPLATTPGATIKKTAPQEKTLSASEKIKKMTVQEQMRREREEKERQREKLFGLFGAAGRIERPSKEVKVTPKKTGMPKIVIKKITKPAPTKIIKKPQSKSVFDRLGEFDKKKEGIWDRLSKLRGETEFEKLEKVGKGKKAEDIEKVAKKKRGKK